MRSLFEVRTGIVFSQTAKYYSALDKDLKLELLKMYRYDFELFGYDWKKYF